MDQKKILHFRDRQGHSDVSSTIRSEPEGWYPQRRGIRKLSLLFASICFAVIAYFHLFSFSYPEPVRLLRAHEKHHCSDGGYCTPPLPRIITHHPFSSDNPILTRAKKSLLNRLNSYAATTNDSIYLTVLHGDYSSTNGGSELFSWSTSPDIDKHTIFRIASITKVFTVLEGLILQGRSKVGKKLSMTDHLREHLPEFHLPGSDGEWAEEITLNMLGGHTAGLPRDVSVYVDEIEMEVEGGRRVLLQYQPWYRHGRVVGPKEEVGNVGDGEYLAGMMSKQIRDTGNVHITAPGKCRVVQKKRDPQHPRKDENEKWHQCTKPELFSLIVQSRLLWPPGEMVSYSNTGFDLLGWALQNFDVSLREAEDKKEKPKHLLRDLVTRDILRPLGMNSSFFHPIPEHLVNKVSIPVGEHMVGLDFGEAYDPAGGMYSTAHDLSLFLLSLLNPTTTPFPLSQSKISSWLKPTFPLPNGVSAAGIPWEIEARIFPPLPPSPPTFLLNTFHHHPEIQKYYNHNHYHLLNHHNHNKNFPTYNVYSKGGALPGHNSHITIIPDLSLAVIALASAGSPVESQLTRPETLSTIANEEIVPALRQIMGELAEESWAGEYIQHPTSSSHYTAGKAKISFSPHSPGPVLFLDSLVTSKNQSLLAHLDKLRPSAGYLHGGGKLWPSRASGHGGAVEQEFRISGGRRPETRPGRRGCREWFGFDEDTVEGGWGVDKVVLRRYVYGDDDGEERERGWELVYEPWEVVLRKADAKE